MIDLSYLTEEEQEMIMAVLKRDAELKKAEEERIKRLQKNERDKSKLKYLTGEWFYETKSQRHRDRIHGSDIIRASMKQRKAVTLLELTKLWAEKPSFVNSANQDVFVPAELSGLIEEPLAQPKERRENSSLPSGIHQEEVTTAVQSSAKRRQNPFNSSLMESKVTKETEQQLTNGATEQIMASEGGQHECHAESHALQLSTTQYSADEIGYNETQSPVLRVPLKRISSRPMSFSKSLEDITSPSTISSVPAPPSSSFSDPEQMKKLSTSVPAFLQEENDGRDSDSETESSFHTGRQRRTGSASTNFSTSSGMASMSSVSGSVMSIYSGDFGNVEVKGTIQFAINYVQKLGEFHIFVVQCKDLAVADPRKNRSDPYVKSYLLPDKAKLGKRKTTVKKKTLSPTYNEILRYRVDMETLKSQTLNLSVWHNDTFGKNSFLGEVDVDLSRWDFRNTQMNDFTLKPKSTSGLQPTDHRGEIRLALRFLHQSSHSKRTPKTGEVQILVKECKNLPFIRGAIDPFVKCSVLPDTSRKSRQKSRVLKRTSNPVFNHTMVFEGFRPEDLQEACVELTVWDHDRLNNHFLGGVRLGLGTGKSYGAVVDWMDSNSDEAMLWERMMDSHNEWVEDVLPLRMLIMARGMLK